MTSFSPAMSGESFANAILPHPARRVQPATPPPLGHKGRNMRAYLVDIIAVSFFFIEWLVYALTLEHSAYGKNSLSARMNVFREVWMRRMLDREARMVDMQIMGSLQ